MASDAVIGAMVYTVESTLGSHPVGAGSHGEQPDRAEYPNDKSRIIYRGEK